MLCFDNSPMILLDSTLVLHLLQLLGSVLPEQDGHGPIENMHHVIYLSSSNQNQFIQRSNSNIQDLAGL